MSICGHQSELPHSPRFGTDGLTDLGTRGNDLLIESVNLSNLQIRKIRVIAELSWRNRVATFTSHDGAISRGIDHQARMWHRMNFESEDVFVERWRDFQITHGNHKTSFRNPRHS